MQIVVATKIDLDSKREVSSQMGHETAAQLGPGLPYVETSAKDKIGVEEPFMQLIQLGHRFGYLDLEQENKSAKKRLRKDAKGRCGLM